MELINELKQYMQHYSNEHEKTARFLSLLQEAPHCFSRDNEKAHFTGSAFIINHKKTYSLLTHHAKLDRWLQPGGHADGKANLLQVALTETEEETGLAEITPLSEAIFDIDIHRIPTYKDIPAHYHYDVRYLIYADPMEPLQISSESHDLRWVKLDEITKYTTEESILRMVKKLYII